MFITSSKVYGFFRRYGRGFSSRYNLSECPSINSNAVRDSKAEVRTRKRIRDVFLIGFCR
jgi:hypothetical protein